MKRTSQSLLLAAGFILLASPALRAAQSITITNPGFESPGVADGTYNASATGWSNVNSATEIGVFNPATADFAAEAPEGVNVGYAFGGVANAGLSQVLGAVLQADASYSLSVKVGNSLTYAYDGYRVQLLANGTLLAEDDNTLSPAANAFVTSTVNYTYNAGLHASLVGQPLEIRLLGKGTSGGTAGQTEFDDVQLTVVLGSPMANPGGPYAVPKDGSLALNGSGSLPSEGQSIITYEWDLNNDGNYDEGISGVTPASISWDALQADHGMTIGANTIKLRVTDDSAPTPKTSTAEGTVTVMPPTATFASTLVQPTFNGADQGYFNPNSPSTAPGQDKWFYEFNGNHPSTGAGASKGQTFTINGNVSLKAVSFRLKSTKKAPVNNYLVRIGTVDTATNIFHVLHSEVVNQPIYWNPDNTTDCYGTWTLASPVTLPVNPVTGSTHYAFDITFVGPSNTDWQGGGIPYPLFENTNVYAGGYKFTCANVNTAGNPGTLMTPDSGRDREFHIDMDATTIVDTTAPTLTAIDDQVGGGPIYQDQVQIAYLLNFDERVDETTIDLADFENLGSGVSIDSVVSAVQTNPYPLPSAIRVVFGISGTGTLQLGVKSGSNIADYASNPVTSPVADDTTITINAGTNPADGNRWWDGTTTAGLTDGVSQGGTATWDTTTTNWDRGFGFANPIAWNNSGGNTAIFGGTAGTVTLDEDMTLDGLTVSLPAAGGGGYSIGSAGEDHTLTFSGTNLVTVTATGNNTNQDLIIRAGIAGSPTMDVAGRNNNDANHIQLLPATGVTHMIGTLNMLNTLGSNKRLILGGESTGNVVDTVTWSVTGNQLMLTKAGTGSWTITNDLAFNTGGSRASRLYVEQGTLTLGGTNHFLTHKIGVATNRASQHTASNLASKLIAKGTITIGDNREYFYVQNAGTLSPGPGVETLTVRWNANNNATTTHAQFNMQNGSTYEWDIASATSTDVIDVRTGGSNFANLILGNITLKINDAGVASAISPTDQLTVFTYETTDPVTRSIGTVSFDTSALGAGWTVGTLALTDDGAGRIYLTGLSFAGGGGTPYQNWATGNEPFSGDANGDSVQDGLAFLLGALTPGTNALGLLPKPAEQNSGDLVLGFDMLNAANRGTAVLKVQWSNDLGVTDLWSANEAVVPETSGTVNGVTFSITPGNPTNRVVATIPAGKAANGKLFSRLSGSEN